MEITQEDYSKRIIVRTTSEKVFKALTVEIGAWWGDQDYFPKDKGDVFTVSWGEPWYQFKISELEQNMKVTWECVDANQIIGELKGVQKEWVGTQLRWEIIELKQGTVELSFTHMGLIHELVCYDFCSNTWDRFISYNLRKYLEDSF